MATNTAQQAVDAITTAIARLLPVVEHIPDSFGKWVPPIKNAIKANEKLAAAIALAGAASKAFRGKLGLIDAVLVRSNSQTAGLSKGFSTLAAVGGLAVSRIAKHFKDASREAARAKLSAAGFEKVLERSGRIAGRMNRGNSNSQLLGKIAASVGVYRLLASAAGRLKGAFDLGDALGDGSTKTGIAVDQLMVLQQAGKDAGVEDTTTAVAKMQDALAGAAVAATPAGKALGVIGLRALELIRNSPVEQLQKIGKGLSEIKNPALKTSLARDIFGKSGGDMLPLLENPKALDHAQGAIGKQAQILAANAEAFGRVSDRLNRSGLKLQGFFVGVADTILPMIDAATSKLEQTDLAAQGQAFGFEMKKAVELITGAFADPSKLAGMLGENLKGAILNALNVLANGLMGTNNKFAAGMLEAVDAMVRAMRAGLEMAVDAVLTRIPGFEGHERGTFADYFKRQPDTGLRDLADDQRAGVKFIDYFGAEEHFKKGAAAYASLMNTGSPKVADFIAQNTGSTSTAAGKGNKFGKLADMITFRSPGLDSSSPLRGASNAGSLYGRRLPSIWDKLAPSTSSRFDWSKVADMSRAGVKSGPILSAAERRAFEDQRVGAGGVRSATTEGAYGVVHKGDANRRKNLQKENERARLKEENSVQRSNELLGGIYDFTRRTTEALE